MQNGDSTYIGFKAPAELADWLREQAKAERRSVSSYIRVLIEDVRERRQDESRPRAA